MEGKRNEADTQKGCVVKEVLVPLKLQRRDTLDKERRPTFSPGGEMFKGGATS